MSVCKGIDMLRFLSDNDNKIYACRVQCYSLSLSLALSVFFPLSFFVPLSVTHAFHVCAAREGEEAMK
jgi:hypothetical protein